MDFHAFLANFSVYFGSKRLFLGTRNAVCDIDRLIQQAKLSITRCLVNRKSQEEYRITRYWYDALYEPFGSVRISVKCSTTAQVIFEFIINTHIALYDMAWVKNEYTISRITHSCNSKSFFVYLKSKIEYFMYLSIVCDGEYAPNIHILSTSYTKSESFRQITCKANATDKNSLLK